MFFGGGWKAPPPELCVALDQAEHEAEDEEGEEDGGGDEDPHGDLLGGVRAEGVAAVPAEVGVVVERGAAGGAGLGDIAELFEVGVDGAVVVWGWAAWHAVVIP